MQIRAARGALGWSAAKLAKEAGLALRTLQSLESEAVSSPPRKSTLLAVRSTLEAAGIEFIGGPGDAPGIRIHAARDETARTSER